MANNNKNIRVTIKNPKNSSKARGSRSKTISVSKKQLKSLIIAVIVIVLVTAIALGAFYLINPAKFRSIFNMLFVGNLPTDYLEGDQMEVRYLDVGQGDSILIRLPDGKNMMIDAGGSKSRTGKRAEDVILDTLKSLKITQIDYLIATHSDEDHVDYLDSVLAAVKVKKVYRPAFLSSSETPRDGLAVVDTKTYNDFIVATYNEPDCEIIENVGLKIIEGKEYSMTIYAPPITEYKIDKVGGNVDAKEKNRVSPISMLEYGGRTMVFTGDSESSEESGNGGEEMLIKYHELKHKKIDCDVLKSGHHGSAPSAGSEFLSIIDVEYAVISVGVANSHEHPRKQHLDRLAAYRDLIPDGDAIGIAKVYRTDLDGGISLLVGANGGMQWKTAVA